MTLFCAIFTVWASGCVCSLKKDGSKYYEVLDVAYKFAKNFKTIYLSKFSRDFDSISNFSGFFFFFGYLLFKKTLEIHIPIYVFHRYMYS